MDKLKDLLLKFYVIIVFIWDDKREDAVQVAPYWGVHQNAENAISSVKKNLPLVNITGPCSLTYYESPFYAQLLILLWPWYHRTVDEGRSLDRWIQ